MIQRRILTRMKKQISIIVAICVILLLSSNDAFPCQTYVLKKGDILIADHNLGMPMHIPGVMVINKRGVLKKGITWYEILSGKLSPTPLVTWVSKYGSLTFNPFCRDFPDGGMNEAGLFIEEMTLGETKFPEDHSKPKIFMMQWMQYALDIHADLSRNVEKNFQDYTLETNRNFVVQSFKALESRGFIDFVQSQGSTVNPVIERISSYSETTTCRK